MERLFGTPVVTPDILGTGKRISNTKIPTKYHKQYLTKFSMYFPMCGLTLS